MRHSIRWLVGLLLVKAPGGRASLCGVLTSLKVADTLALDAELAAVDGC